MTSVIKFFTRTQGSKKLTLVDWVSYIFLFLGFLIIFLPVLWLVLNSIKSTRVSCLQDDMIMIRKNINPDIFKWDLKEICCIV